MESIELIVCLPKESAETILARHLLTSPVECPVTPPHDYPGPDEVWLRIVLNTSLLPPLQSPPDGDSLYELGAKEIGQAIDIRAFSFEELVEHARRRIDHPRPEFDFPFGGKEGLRTWRDLIKAGEETHPVWLAAVSYGSSR